MEHISPGQIQVWEAVLTFSMFPVLVVTAWAVSNRYHLQCIECLASMLQRHRSVSPSLTITSTSSTVLSEDDEEQNALERKKKRRMIAERLKTLKKEHPDKNHLELEGKKSNFK